MRKAIKRGDSIIVANKLQYVSNNTSSNKKIAEVLFNEQKGFCAYTDECLTRSDAEDIEHFNPTLKNTAEDNYNNWLLVKHQWNKEKSTKWDKFQPVLHPTADDFEERIIYIEGDYMAKKVSDLEANNLVELLQLDDIGLAKERKQYIARKRVEIEAFGQDADTFFSTLLINDPKRICYLRAIKEEFNVDLWSKI